MPNTYSFFHSTQTLFAITHTLFAIQSDCGNPGSISFHTLSVIQSDCRNPGLKKSGSPIKLGMTSYLILDKRFWEWQLTYGILSQAENDKRRHKKKKRMDPQSSWGWQLLLIPDKRFREWHPSPPSWGSIFIFLLRENLFFIILIKNWSGFPINTFGNDKK